MDWPFNLINAEIQKKNIWDSTWIKVLKRLIINNCIWESSIIVWNGLKCCCVVEEKDNKIPVLFPSGDPVRSILTERTTEVPTSPDIIGFFNILLNDHFNSLNFYWEDSKHCNVVTSSRSVPNKIWSVCQLHSGSLYKYFKPVWSLIGHLTYKLPLGYNQAVSCVSENLT